MLECPFGARALPVVEECKFSVIGDADISTSARTAGIEIKSADHRPALACDGDRPTLRGRVSAARSSWWRTRLTPTTANAASSAGDDSHSTATRVRAHLGTFAFGGALAAARTVDEPSLIGSAS